MLGKSLKSHFFGLCLVGALWSSSEGPASAAEKTAVYRWDPIPGASYYRGRYKFRGVDVAFRTKSTWLMLKTVSDITVKAISDQGQLISELPVKAAPLTKQSMQSDGTDDHSFVSELAQGKEYDPLAEDEADSIVTFSGHTLRLHPGRFRMSLLLAAGRESFSAQAGVDAYSGNSDVGSTSLALSWQPANATWLVYAQGEAHNLTTVTSGNHNAAKFLRATGKSFLFYELSRGMGDDDSSFAIGAGPVYTKLPVMGITDVNLGTASLRLEATTGPAIAIEAAKNLSEKVNAFGLISYQPLAFNSKLKALSAMGDTFLRWELSAHWTADLTMTWQWYRINADASCEIAACQNFSQATSSLFMVGAGSGVKF
ncbi:MAG: hypothetical protein FJ146_12410 [Deltaproteobacteria bacterium]|nr:hypothetical protein [Deltaproteobacteria bacterium]